MGHIRTEPGVWGLLESGVSLVCYHPEYDAHSTASSSLALECHFVKLSPCHLAAIWATGPLVVPCSDVHFVWYLHQILTYLSNITVSSIPESNKGLDDWGEDDIYKEYLGINSIFSGPLVTIWYVLRLVTMCKAVVCIMSGFVQIIIVLLPRCKQSPDIFII